MTKLTHTTTEQPTAVLYTYFSYNDYQGQTALNIMASLLRQLLSQLPIIPLEVESIYMCCSPNYSRPELSTLFRLFVSCMTKFSSVLVVFDGLDECEGAQLGEIVPLIRQITSLSIKVLITTRPHLAYIEQQLGQTSNLTISAQTTDIKKYVQERLDNERKISPRLRESILEKVVGQADGM